MTHMKLRPVATLMLCTTLLVGCGGSDDSNSSAAPGASANPPSAQIPVSTNSQLVGSWYRNDAKAEPSLLGMEFTADGKALLYSANGQTVTLDYSVMDGGRLRLNAPNGQTMLFDCKVDSQALKLTAQGDALFAVAEFHRLASDQNIPQARKDELAAIAHQREVDLADIQSILKQPKLVLATINADDASNGVALDITGDAGNYQGGAYVKNGDDATLRRVAVSIQPATDQSDSSVNVILGDVVGPIGQENLAPQTITVNLDRSGGTPALASKSVTIKSNASAYDAITAHYQSVEQQREAKIDKAIAPLGAYTRITGEFAYPNNPNSSFKVDFGLLRVAGKRLFKAANLQNKSDPAVSDFNMDAGVQLKGDEVLIVCPALNIAMKPVVGADGKLSLAGQYGNYNLPDAPVALTLTQEQLDAINGRIQDFLTKQLPAGIELTGYMLKNSKADLPCPVMFSFKGSGTDITGINEVLHLDGSYNLAAQPKVTLTSVLIPYKSTSILKRGPSTLFSRGRDGTIRINFLNEQPVCDGDLHGSFEVGPAQLVLTTAETLAAQKQKLSGILAGGATFVCTDPIQPRRDPPSISVKLDPATGQVTGTISKGFSFAIHPGAVSGQFKEQDGMLVLDLTQPSFDDKPRIGAHHVLYAVRDNSDHLWLSGWTLATDSNPPNVAAVKFVQAQ